MGILKMIYKSPSGSHQYLPPHSLPTIPADHVLSFISVHSHLTAFCAEVTVTFLHFHECTEALPRHTLPFLLFLLPGTIPQASSPFPNKLTGCFLLNHPFLNLTAEWPPFKLLLSGNFTFLNVILVLWSLLPIRLKVHQGQFHVLGFFSHYLSPGLPQAWLTVGSQYIWVL